MRAEVLRAPREVRRAHTQTKKNERVQWSKFEDATIVHSVAELGHKWYLIAQRLPGRTDHAIRNRYHRLQAMSEDQQGLIAESPVCRGS